MAELDVVTPFECGQISQARHIAKSREETRQEGIWMMTVTHEIDGKVGVVTLAKPPHNLLDDKLISDLIAAYQSVVSGGCRAILLRSAMRHFCAGAEMKSWGT